MLFIGILVGDMRLNFPIDIRNNYYKIQKVALFLLATVLIVWMFPNRASFKYEFQKGKPWMHENLIAPYDFPVYKSNEQLSNEQLQVRDNLKPTFVVDESVYEIKAEEFISNFEQKWAIDKNLKKDIRFTFFNLNKKKQRKTKKEKLAFYGLNVLENLYSKGIVQLIDDIENQEDDFEIIVMRSNVGEVKRLGKLYTIESASKKAYELPNLADNEKEFLAPLILQSLKQNVFYDEDATNKMLDSELNEISKGLGMVQRGEVIISQGELVTESNFQKLESYRLRYEGENWQDNSERLLSLGQSLLVLIAFLILFLFLKQFRPEVFIDNKKVTFILTLIIIMVLMATLSLIPNNNLIFLMPFCLLPIIIKAFFDTRLALFTHLIAIIIIGFIVPNSFEFIYLQLMAGIVSILSVLQMYKRAQLFVSAAKIIGVYFLTYFAMALTQEGSIDNIEWMNFVWFAGNGALTLFAYPLIFAFEKTFSLVSDVSLLELSDTNNPLLRKLAQKAPGTFQHSIQVANLAEEGILEIGGNALLVRAGALYHDIGKMKNPQFFIENQISGINPHDDMSFEESARIIIEHVKNGIEIAKEYNLPDELIDFIRTHHGTTMVGYFYKQHISSFPDELESEDKFIYPGPKPFSKETAVLMMSDSVEAAARSLKSPTVENIDKLVENIINHQIDQNQFVNADITLKSITKIKKLFKKKLQSIHHLRVEY
ncbi:HDIG domain-containing protein [Flavobacteriales bacterium]|nr:HDIG domain-containing protein [Flavobacteriales bacterium]